MIDRIIDKLTEGDHHVAFTRVMLIAAACCVLAVATILGLHALGVQ